ncbi:MAG: GNAT family N-acetyltransferase [Bacteroidales bacterium]|nr:GNAT family N-acetyltransferase [Bacteroidales bacterium]
MIIAMDGDVILRELEEADIDEIVKNANNEKVSINLRDAFPHPYSAEDAKRFLEIVEKQNPKTIFAIEYKGIYAGNISLTPGSDVYRYSAEIGYFIGEPFWNKGIMTKAINLMTTFGFNKLGLIRIYAGVFEFNKASQRVLEKCGYEKEAVLKKAIYKKGTFYDEIRYAKINPAI